MRCWIAILTMAGAALPSITFAKSPAPDLSRVEDLYRQTEYTAVIDAVQAIEPKTAAGYALLGKAQFMEGRYKEAVVNLEKAVAANPANSDYHDWLGRAYGRIAESSSFLSALGYAKKTVCEFERATELGPSNLEALSDLFEYYLQAPGIAGGGVDKAENIANRIAALNQAEYHWACARLAEKRRSIAAAEREYRAALAAEPNEVGRTLDLAAFLSSHRRYSESEALFRRAAETHPNSPKVLFARAAAYVQSKRNLEEARALLRTYLQSQITSDDPFRHEAVALMNSVRH